MLQLDKIHRSQSSLGVVSGGHADGAIQQKENKCELSKEWQKHQLHKAEVTESFGGDSPELVYLHSLGYTNGEFCSKSLHPDTKGWVSRNLDLNWIQVMTAENDTY